LRERMVRARLFLARSLLENEAEVHNRYDNHPRK